jgi:transposase
LRIVEEAPQCSAPGERGALLRREGLYSAHLTHWRQELKAGPLAGLKPKLRGREVDPLAVENATLRRQMVQMQAKLERAESKVQKKSMMATAIRM